MSTHGAFWYLLGALSGVAAVFILIPLFRSSSLSSPKRVAVTLGVALLPALAAFAFYAKTGSPALAGTVVAAPAGQPAGHPAAAGAPAGEAGGQAGSMEEAVARLQARVDSGQGSDADWALLAQSYEFLGRTADAERARAHVAGAAGAAVQQPAVAAAPSAPAGTAGTAIGRAQQSAAQFEAAVARNPKDAASWFGLAQERRVAREFGKANEAYAKALALDPKNADAWADYADSLASDGGRTLTGRPAQAIQRTLALKPDHVKGLWLSASLALEEHRYGDALTQWQRLRSVLPAGSPDLAIIEGNISEARLLAGGGAPSKAPAALVAAAAAAPAAAARVAGGIEGSVDVDAALRKQVQAGMTLFIYAKTPDGKGAPLAVIRLPVGQWPVRFRLDDSQAMMPGRTLSGVDTALVEARLSISGNAIAEKGDLLAPGQVLPTRGAKPIQLKISRPVT
jgi:cytochrome c-type biogenesis protein CcmH